MSNFIIAIGHTASGNIVCGLIGAGDYGDGEWKLGWNRNEVGWYAFGEEGRMYCGYVTPDGFRVDETGNWIR